MERDAGDGGPATASDRPRVTRSEGFRFQPLRFECNLDPRRRSAGKPPADRGVETYLLIPQHSVIVVSAGEEVSGNVTADPVLVRVRFPAALDRLRDRDVDDLGDPAETGTQYGSKKVTRRGDLRSGTLRAAPIVGGALALSTLVGLLLAAAASPQSRDRRPDADALPARVTAQAPCRTEAALLNRDPRRSATARPRARTALAPVSCR